MQVTDLPIRTQDYLKTIFDIQERTGKAASLSEIAEAMQQKMPTASEALRKLAEQELVERIPYQGVTLTAQGRSFALAIIRRHRIIETFLVSTLGFGWEEVHEEAEMLEHAISDRLLARLDEFLHYPSRDPHGDPIPTADGHIHHLRSLTLADVEVGESVCIERIQDSDPDLLNYLRAHEISPGARVEVCPAPMEGMTAIRRVAEDSEALVDPARQGVSAGEAAVVGEVILLSAEAVAGITISRESA